jgi:hypothetical protein
MGNKVVPFKFKLDIYHLYSYFDSYIITSNNCVQKHEGLTAPIQKNFNQTLLFGTPCRLNHCEGISIITISWSTGVSPKIILSYSYK